MESQFIAIRKKLFQLRRKLGLLPYQKIFKRLSQRNPNLIQWNVLDLFAGDGTMFSLDLKGFVGKIELWDIKPQYETILKNRFPLRNVYERCYNIH